MKGKKWVFWASRFYIQNWPCDRGTLTIYKEIERGRY